MIVPFFLQAGAHVTRDIPQLIERVRKQHPDIEIMVTGYVGAHPLMAKVVEELAGKGNCGDSSAECGVEKQKDL
jgi:sirohydrochlorin ferrochelatase